ncbi:hypothetical protein [Thermococcus sp.]|uniref:hypothetical protein n=1 Tax=Thermococcus sp. TaxID=35749 RepID=UPI00261B792E|nr:hypothetical protein [Thermococcus sp.]
MSIREVISFIEEFFVTFNPWLAIVAGATVSITKRNNRYYSERETSVMFVIGAISGLLGGLAGFGKDYLQWWSPYSKGILSSLIGIKLWIPGLMVGLAIWGILKDSKNEKRRNCPMTPSRDGKTMKRWGLIFPTLYFFLLFLMAFVFNFPREVTRQWMWVQVGGIVFMTTLGLYFDGHALPREVITIGIFTLIWLGASFVVDIQKGYFTLFGLIIELFLILFWRGIGMRKAKALGMLLILFIICTETYVHRTQNSEFNSLIASHPHILGGIFLGNSTYYEYYQVNTSEGTRYYRVVRADSSKVLKIQAISHSDYLIYTGKALDMARSLVEESGKLPSDANLMTYNVTNLTVRLYYSIGGNEKSTEGNNSNVTSKLSFPGEKFAIARVNLTSENISVRIVPFEELPEWVQNVVTELRGLGK